jgi:DNA adenine methylase
MGGCYCSPLRYPGGKNAIFNFMVALLKENDLFGRAYAEPYAGGAGLALRLLFNGYVSKVYINDLDRSIYAFWHTVLYDSNKFCDWIGKVQISTANWLYFKEVQKQRLSADLFELAQSTFFLNRTNVSGVLTGGIIGGLNQSGNYKIDARFNKVDLIARMQEISKQKEKISVTNLDGLQFIDRLEGEEQNAFVYLDPPYYLKGAKLYMNFYKKVDHERLARRIRQMRQDWVVSYDNHQSILNLYRRQRRVVYRLQQGTSNRIGDEVLIFGKRLRFDTALGFLHSPTLVIG